jgi:hypothetical protein
VSTTDGFAQLGRLTGLPCLPYDYANGVASDSMVQIMRTTVEVATNETFNLLANLVSESLDNTRSFWESVDAQSKLLPLVDTTGKFDNVSGRLGAEDIGQLKVMKKRTDDLEISSHFKSGSLSSLTYLLPQDMRTAEHPFRCFKYS